jgi:alkylation response protein AidB-like acyl-CoA dehydrogenase
MEAHCWHRRWIYPIARRRQGGTTMELNRSQREIRKAARDFAKGEFFKDMALEMEDQGVFPEKIWKKAGDLGFLCTHFPDSLGGGGLGMFESVLVTEAFCRQDASIGSALSLSGFAAECLLRFGDEALKQSFLPAVIEGRSVSAGAFGEPGLGWNGSALQTEAHLQGGQWIINGRKTYVINGGRADFYIVLCLIESQTAGMILVQAKTQGIEARTCGRKLGGNLTAMADLDFTDVRVPEAHLLGPVGQGWVQLEQFWNEACILTAAQAVGMAAGAFDRTLAYIKEREAFGRKLALFEITRHKIAEMAASTQSARSVVYQAARQWDAGHAGLLPAVAKLAACRAALAVTDEAVQLFGGYGYMKEQEVERFFREAKATALLLGGEAALKRKIADDVIGISR